MDESKMKQQSSTIKKSEESEENKTTERVQQNTRNFFVPFFIRYC